MMGERCKICGEVLGSEPLAIDEDRQAHSACIELERERETDQRAADGESYLRFGNGHPFEPNPSFYNHMCHWAPWAEHFRNDESDVGTLANMLGSALEEIDRLQKLALRREKARVTLLWAFVDLVETGVAKPLSECDEPQSMADAMASIHLLNRWRSENKLNIRLVDL